MSHPERHPIADLLTREERARVLQYEWELRPFGLRTWGNFGFWCPLGIALDCPRTSQTPPMFVVVEELRARGRDPEGDVIHDFIHLNDTGQIAPADLPAVLGLDQEDC